MPDIFNFKKIKRPAQPKKPQQEPPIQQVKKQTSVQPETKTDPVNNLGFFTTFLENPGGIRFSEQDSTERIVLFLRRDFGTNTPWLAATIILTITPILLRFIFHATGFTLPFLPANFVRLFIVFYYFVVFGFAFSNFLTWFFTVGLITDKRAVDIDFVNVSSINFASADLTDIIDAKYSQNGFSQSFFDYGDVELVIQTPQEKLSFEKAPRPSQVANIINDLIGKSNA